MTKPTDDPDHHFAASAVLQRAATSAAEQGLTLKPGEPIDLRFAYTEPDGTVRQARARIEWEV